MSGAYKCEQCGGMFEGSKGANHGLVQATSWRDDAIIQSMIVAAKLTIRNNYGEHDLCPLCFIEALESFVKCWRGKESAKEDD